MDAVQIKTVIDTVSSGGLIGVLILIIWTGATKRWVFGWVYEQERLSKEEWKALALRGTHTLRAAVSTLETVATKKDGV